MGATIHWLALGLLAGAVLPAFLSVREFARARQAAYYVLRRNALRRALRWLIVVLGLVCTAVILLALRPVLQTSSSSLPSPTLMATSAPTVVFLSTSGPAVEMAPTAIPTRAPTATAPPIPTVTPSVALPPCALNLTSSVSSEEGHIELLAVATGQDAAGRPIDPGYTFPSGQHPMLLFFHYRGMKSGVPVTVAWYRGTECLEGCCESWLWGQLTDRRWGEEGNASVACTPPGGWEPGMYEVRVFIEARLHGIAQFMIE